MPNHFIVRVVVISDDANDATGFSAHGGAIANSKNGSLTVTNSTFSHNATDNTGGAILLVKGVKTPAVSWEEIHPDGSVSALATHL